MFESLRTHLLRLWRVPPDPQPPAGAPGSVQVFRAGRNFYKLRLLRWAFGQLGALAGIAFSLAMLSRLESAVDEARRELRLKAAAPARVVAPATPSPPTPAAAAPIVAPPAAVPAPPAKATPGKSGNRLPRESRQGVRSWLQRVVERWPAWVLPLVKFLECCGIVAYVAQIPLTYALVRLDFELRWYIVTDRSLRIRSGMTTMRESTMSFANVQQVVVTQGPLQRFLGLADVRVQSAGGGGDSHEEYSRDSLHTGVFHGVENASEIRDLILQRLRLFRAAGLGDPDETPPEADLTAPRPTSPPEADATLAAARELLAEARQLRAAIRS